MVDKGDKIPISSNCESLFNPLQHYGPVTSLKIHENLIICGYGPILKIFEQSNNNFTLIYSRQILKRNKIHGIFISPCKTKIVAIGGRSFTVLNINNRQEIAVEKAINEWIISAEFLDSFTVLLLTSHNVIYKIDISDNNHKYNLVEKIDCGEKSILYSGSVRVGKEKTIIAAGTVMDGIIIWDLSTKEIIYRLSEHKGSIFGVKIDRDFKYIISCSDDRSIKLYNFESGELLSEGWGHGARIWNLDFFNNGKDLNIISMSEDCSTRIWRYENTGKLRQLEVIDDCHLGKHVWSGDVDDTFNNIAVTGGADGRIRVHDLGILNNNSITYTIEDIATKATIQLGNKEALRSFVELSDINYLVCLTTLGQLLIFNQNNGTWSSNILTLDELSILGTQPILKRIPNSNGVLISSLSGEILMLEFESGKTDAVNRTLFDNQGFAGNKVTNLLVSFDGDSTYYVLSSCPRTSQPFEIKEIKKQKGKLILTDKFALEQPQIPTFAVCSLEYDPVNNWLLIFARNVCIMVYDLNTKESHLFKKVCPGDTITSAAVIESVKGSLKLLITVRDGIYMILTVTKNESFQININLQNKTSRGFIEGGFFKDNDFIFYGFRSSYFYIWNETKQLEITKVLCGGFHRFWSLFKYNKAMSDYKFIYLNKSNLTITNFKERFNENYGLINDGTHGREIRGLSISSGIEEDDTRLIVTASEDAVVRLGKLFENGDIKYYWCMNNHLSGMQNIKFINENYVASSAAQEEFFIWKIDKLSSGIPLINLYASLIPSTSIPDLRVMDFSFLSIDDRFLIATVYSDSHIKIWDFNFKTKQFKLLIDGFYTTCCVLNVNFIARDGRIYVLTGATDGHIAIWRIDNLLNNNIPKLDKPIIKQQLHQSGIKAIKIVQNDDVKIITGGDDNALILSTLKFDNEDISWHLDSFIDEAASATISSISAAGDNKIIVTSVDQIVRMWSYADNELTLLSARYTTVADTESSDSTVINNTKLSVIGGAGLSVWKH